MFISSACAFCGLRPVETNNPDKKPAHSGYKLGRARVFSIPSRPVLMLKENHIKIYARATMARAPLPTNAVLGVAVSPSQIDINLRWRACEARSAEARLSRGGLDFISHTHTGGSAGVRVHGRAHSLRYYKPLTRFTKFFISHIS